MDFLNPSLQLSELPETEAADFQPLHRKYLKLSLLSSSLFWLGTLVAGLTFISVQAFWGENVWIIAGLIGWFVLMIGRLGFIYAGFNKKAYAIRQRDILYQTGLIWHQTIAVPYNRIQHVSVDQGPIARYFGLAHLNVFTAGGSSSDLTIPGLTLEAAQQIKDFVLKQSVDQHESE